MISETLARSDFTKFHAGRACKHRRRAGFQSARSVTHEVFGLPVRQKREIGFFLWCFLALGFDLALFSRWKGAVFFWNSRV